MVDVWHKNRNHSQVNRNQRIRITKDGVQPDQVEGFLRACCY